MEEATDGWMDGGSLCALCLAASRLSGLMEIPSLIAAAGTLCRHVVDNLSDSL